MYFTKALPRAILPSSSLSFASNPDGTKWYVEDKLCGFNGMQVLPGEKVQFANGFFVKASLISETSIQECFQVWAYTRITQSSSEMDGNYQEGVRLKLKVAVDRISLSPPIYHLINGP